MKYRIIERNDGKFVIEFSRGFFQGWERTHYLHFKIEKVNIFSSLKEAESFILDEIKEIERKEQKEKSLQTKRIVKVFRD